MKTIATVAITGSMILVGALASAQTPAPTTAPPEQLTQLEDAFTRVAERSFPAVVVITNKRTERRPMYPPGMIPPEFRFFFGMPENEDESEGEGDSHATRPHGAPHTGKQTPQAVGKGSGIVLREDGYVLTNYHVIKDSDALEVRLHDGKVYDSAKDRDDVVIVGQDEETDLAILRIGKGKLNGLPTLPFADSGKVKIGQFAIAIGAPFNFDYSVAIGHVSQKGRYDVNINTYENYIQTDASINPGNSGGPLLNLRGEVIGINEFIISPNMGQGSVGLGFAISSNLARQVADSMIANKGSVIRPWLGLSMQSLSEEMKQSFKATDGVLVNDVFKDDPADKAGLNAGDVLVKVGDTPVRTPHDVQFAVLAYKPGDKIPLLVDRRGERKTFMVVARQKSGKEGSLAERVEGGPELFDKLGLRLEESADGIKVAAVSMGSPAAAVQLRKGDSILEVNRHPVRKIRDVVEALGESANQVAVFYVERRGQKFFIPLPLSEDKE